jgi:hypothetical protein
MMKIETTLLALVLMCSHAWMADPASFGLAAENPDAPAQDAPKPPLTGDGAAIEFLIPCEIGIFRKGEVIYTDRPYRLLELPEALQDKHFLRSSIDRNDVRVTQAGVLSVVTPEPGHPRACTLEKTLEKRGFFWVTSIDVFQLFGDQPFDRVRVYQKLVQPGERFKLPKWGVILGFREAIENLPKKVAWSENTGEKLYNGIVLPERWPPDDIDPRDAAPMAVPYLESRPAVVPIDVGRQLLMDDFLIERTDLTRTFHMPVKYAGNPVLKPETELEINAPRNAAAVPKSGGLWWDPAEQVFKMWYEAGWIHTICYATSKDGLQWDRPALDVNPGTNQVLPPDLTPDSWTVVPDWNAKDPQQKYKMFMRPPGGNMPGVSMTSPDGIHWINRIATGDTGDRSTMFYNPFRRKWVYSLRSGFRGRSRHYWEADDFLAGASWGMDEPVVWAAADRDDPPDPDIGDAAQLYNLDAVAYESILLGMFEIHRGPNNEECMQTGLPKITELNFAYSRDGFHWHRPDRRTHIPAERRDVWDRAYVQSLGNICTVRGDKLWIYYTGFQGDSNKLGGNWLQNGMYDRGATGVALLRRDGFVSLDAGAEPGTLVTRPVTFCGKQLFVNVDSPRGVLRVEVLDQDGQPIQPFTLENSIPICMDSTLEPVVWKEGGDLSSLGDRLVRFRFELTNGSLYAFWVSPDETGRSGGYVAGGGPGFSGMTDTVGRGALEAEQRLGLRDLETR